MFSPQLTDKIINILSKQQQQREYEQNHLLSIQLKKRMASISNITDWMMMVKCIQLLQIKSPESIINQQISWIFVLKGQFTYHNMTYKEGQQMQVLLTDCDYFQFKQSSLYLVLTHKAKEIARLQSQQRMIAQQKLCIRKILFEGTNINNKDYNYFWNLMKTYKIKKQMEFPIKQYDDMIFIVINGNLNMNYRWKRLIKLRQLGEGSIFSTFLGRYIYKTNQQLKKMEKYQFQYIAKTDTIVLGFSPDLFYEDERLIGYKSVISKAWSSYQQKIESVKRIIDGIGLMRPEKKQVKKYIKDVIQEKYLREKCVSVPVAFEKRKLRNIAYSIFSERSNRRKIKNSASTTVVKTMQNSFFTARKQNPQKEKNVSSTINTKQDSKRLKTKGLDLDLSNVLKRSNTQQVRHFKTLSQSKSLQNKRSSTTRVRTEGIQLRETNTNFYFEQKHKKQSAGSDPHFYQFFRREQFVSKKLQNQYDEIVQELRKIKNNSKDAQLRDQYKNRKQYFQAYINERRIIKLGPQKRLLFKHTQIY